MNTIKTILSAAVIGGLFALPTFAGQPATGAATSKKAAQTVCPVSGEKLGSMGKPFVHKYKDQEVQMCCKGCLKDFEKDPAKYLKKMQAGTVKPAAPHSHSGGNHDGHKH